MVQSIRTDGRTDRQTESDAYEPTVKNAQVGSKMHMWAQKAELSIFFLVGAVSSTSEDSSTVEYSECGLRDDLKIKYSYDS